MIYTQNNPMIFRLLTITFCLLSSALQAGETLHIFAAASLAEPLEELSAEFPLDQGQKISLSFASSSTLAQQIIHGAPSALYLSANSHWVDYLQENKNNLVESRQHILGNTLVIASHQDANINAFTFSPALKIVEINPQHGRIALGNPDYVPSGIYAREALESIGQWQSWRPYLAPANNARSALALTERQEAAFGIHYRSDVVNHTELRILSEIPAQLHSPIKYEMVLIRENATALARKYAEFLTSASSKRVFKKYGFTLPEERH